MRLAIVHYHLRKGGVTKVISSALQALGDTVESVVVLSSTEPEEPMACPSVVIPELAYTEAPSMAQVEQLHDAMLNGARQALGGEPDLWHIHNHCLGKNVNFPPVLNRLLQNGHRALLQIHDFAEDGRPDNYTRQRAPFIDGRFEDYDTCLYPVAPQIGYAVLNGRDRKVLEQAGIPSAQIHWLPNAVNVPDVDPRPGTSSTKKPLVLYPTRAIRRKNLGELLLLSITSPEARFGTSLVPKNPQWLPIHEQWRQLSGELALDVEFGMGEKPGATFESLIAEASAMATTSVGEGFGLAFLEPWLWGKPLCGRNLPEITGDFLENGITLPDLYEGLPVPLSFFNEDSMKSRFLLSLQSAYRSYGESFSPNELEQAWISRIKDGTIDFGSLDETAQAEVLREAAAHPDKLNSPYPDGFEALDTSVLPDNTAHIRSMYGLSRYGEKLASIYGTITEAAASPVEGLPANGVLAGFLDPGRFRMLLT